MHVLDARLVVSAAGGADLPRGGPPCPEVALVGRSNVGKSSLINALVRRRVARTSAAPGKTRLVNLYEVQVHAGTRRRLHLVDLPGYGYTRGGAAARRAFDRLIEAYFARGEAEGPPDALLVVDARHPGLPLDLAAQDWLRARGADPLVVATKIDTLSRAARARADRDLRDRFKTPVVAVSARTGEGLEDLWTHLLTLATRTRTRPPTSRSWSSRGSSR